APAHCPSRTDAHTTDSRHSPAASAASTKPTPLKYLPPNAEVVRRRITAAYESKHGCPIGSDCSRSFRGRDFGKPGLAAPVFHRSEPAVQFFGHTAQRRHGPTSNRRAGLRERGRLFCSPGKAEIQHLNSAGFCLQPEIGRLDVAVDQPAL